MNSMYIIIPILLFGCLTLVKYEGEERRKCEAVKFKHKYKPFDGCYIMRGDFTYWEKAE